MTQKNQIYKCNICGNIVSVVEAHEGQLVCCNQPMNLLEEKTSSQEGKEKHVPIIETSDGKVTVRVGSIPHPMEDNHYIEFIQLLKNGIVIAEKQFQPGEEPVATFCIDNNENIIARELCNVHGLWRS